MPVYAVVPTSTIDLQLSSGKEIPIEIRDKMEVICVDGAIVAPVDSDVYNPAFDVTPHQYITAIITEKGICYPPFSESLKKIVTACLVFSKVQFCLLYYARDSSNQKLLLKRHNTRFHSLIVTDS